MAKGFKTGGRKKGVRNKKTLLREQARAAASINPMEFFLGVMRSDVVDPKLRLEAGKAAATYLYKKPTENAPGDAARLIDGATVPVWTQAEEERRRYLGGRSYAPGLADDERKEYDALEKRKYEIEELQRLAQLTTQPWTEADASRLAELQALEDECEAKVKALRKRQAQDNDVSWQEIAEAEERGAWGEEYEHLRARWHAMTPEGQEAERRIRERFGL